MIAPILPTERSYRLGVSILAAAAAIALLYYGRILIITIIIAAIIAFLLDPLVKLFMRLRMPRGLASFLVCSISLMFLYLAGLGVYSQASMFVDELPTYGARINEIVDNAAARMEKIESSIYRTVVPRRFQDNPATQPSSDPNTSSPPAKGKRNKKVEPEQPTVSTVQEVRVRQEPTSLVAYMYDYVRSFYDVLLMASFVPFLIYFSLAWGDHLRSRLLSTLEGEPRYTAERLMEGVGTMVRAYVIGNFVLGIFLSIASAILFAAVQVPYWLVVAPVSGFLSLVPYIGLPLALAPPLLAALPKTDPAVFIYISVSVALLHLFAMNLLYPKFVGSRVHLNPLVATLALMFWGMLWGAIGLILAIPITAAIKGVCENVDGWKSYGRMLGD